MTDLHDDVSDLRSETPLSELRKPDVYGRTSPQKILVGLVGMGAVGWVMFNIFMSFGLRPSWYFDNKFLIGIVAIVVGVGGAAVLFWFLNMFVEGLPQRASLAVIPYAYLLPGFGLMTLMLLYPAILTIHNSFANEDTSAYVGFENYRTIFADQEFRESLFNNLLWLIVVPAITVTVGIAVAVLADKLSKRGESIAKSIIFLPMAISFVGASAIWKLVYAYDNPNADQTGLLNWFWVNLFQGDPQTWLNNSTLHLNSFLMMVILIWLQVGFAMTLLSSAIKGVPEDTMEAARIDGASEWQIFWKVVLPQIKGTTITVFITVLILVLKVFDIVYVLTNGRFNSNVIANLFFLRLFKGGDNGVSSAIVVVLLVAVLPVLVYQVRHFRAEEANR
jgi:alpha-glucoside transport system permease protein